MNETRPDVLSVVVERELPFPPEKIWRALTQPHLLSEWLMKNDFAPMAGHRFKLSADWGSVECQVRSVEPGRKLSYTWDTKELRSVVTWTLTPAGERTRLRMEQTGFEATQQAYYRGAQAGWPRFFTALEDTLARMN